MGDDIACHSHHMHHSPPNATTHPQAPYHHACEDLIALQYAHTLYHIHPSTDPHPSPNPPPHLLSIRMMMLGDGA